MALAHSRSLSMDEVARHLAANNMFDGVEPMALETIAKKFHSKTYAAEHNIVVQGEHEGDVYLLISGSVRATLYSPSGREISYRELSAGDFFGELSAVDGSLRSTHVITNEECCVLVIARQKFLNLMEEQPKVATAVMQKMAGLIRFLSGRIYEFSALDVNCRVRMELIRMAEIKGETSEEGVVIREMPTHQEFASRISTHREAVTRELNRLMKVGLLSRMEKGKGLNINDLEGLRASIECKD